MQVSVLLQVKGPEVVTVPPDLQLSAVVATLSRHRIGAVVVSSDGRHVDGVLSERDVVEALSTSGGDALGRSAQ